MIKKNVSYILTLTVDKEVLIRVDKIRFTSVALSKGNVDNELIHYIPHLILSRNITSTAPSGLISI